MAKVPTEAPTSCRINDKDIREFGLELVSYPNELLLPPVRRISADIASRPGTTLLSLVYDAWNFTIDCQIRGDTHEDVQRKIDEFKRWIDLAQHYSPEWLVGQSSIEALKFELAGHRYYYTEGAISVTNGSATVSGSGTYWLFYAKPGVEFRIGGDDTRYTVKHVNSDNSIVLSDTVGRASGSGLSYKLERRRYLLINYNGTSGITKKSVGHFADDTYNVSIGFKVAYPYWIGDQFEQEFSSISAGDFKRVKGVGTAIHNPIYLLQGSATNPEIVAGSHSFNSIFLGDGKYRDIRNLTDKEPDTWTLGSGGGSYESAYHDEGISFENSGDYLSFYANLDESSPSTPIADRFNGYTGTISFIYRPTYGSTSYDSGVDAYLWYANSTYYMYVDRTDNTFYCKTGQASEITVTKPSFSADEDLLITVTWDDNTPSFRAVIENLDTPSTQTTTDSSAITTANPGQQIYFGNDSSGSNPADGIMDNINVFSGKFIDDLSDAFNPHVRYDDDPTDFPEPVAYFSIDGSGTPTQDSDHGSSYYDTLTASSYDGTDTFTFTKNADKVFAVDDEICIWSTSSSNKYYDTVASVSSTSLTVTTGGSMTLSGSTIVSKNLLADADMELNNMNYWTVSAGTVAKYTGQYVWSGQRCMEIDTDSSPSSAGCEQDVDLTANAYYKVSGWCRPIGTYSAAAEILEVGSSNNLKVTHEKSRLSGSGVLYKFIEIAFQAENTSETIYFRSGVSGVNQYAYWDNVRLIKLEQGLEDPSMEYPA